MADGKDKSPGNFFNSDGIVLQNGTPVVNGEKYYCSATGELKTGWLTLGNMRLYFDPETYAAYTEGVYEIDGQKYVFNANGVMTGLA